MAEQRIPALCVSKIVFVYGRSEASLLCVHKTNQPRLLNVMNGDLLSAYMVSSVRSDTRKISDIYSL